VLRKRFEISQHEHLAIRSEYLYEKIKIYENSSRHFAVSFRRIYDLTNHWFTSTEEAERRAICTILEKANNVAHEHMIKLSAGAMWTSSLLGSCPSEPSPQVGKRAAFQSR
jgi:hypothetical protein